MGNKLRRSDITDTEIADAVELASDGTTVIRSGVTVDSATHDTKTIIISGWNLLDPDHPVEAGDIVIITGGAAAGTYTVASVTDGTTLVVSEDIADANSGTATFYYPAGATKIGVDPTGLIHVTETDVQGAIAELDAACGGGTDTEPLIGVGTIADANPAWEFDLLVPKPATNAAYSDVGFAPNGPQGAPFYVGRPCTVDLGYIKVHTASGVGGNRNISLAIYRNKPGSVYPGELVSELGTVSTASTGVKTLTPASPIVLAPGWYWLIWWADHSGTNPRFYSLNSIFPVLGAADGPSFAAAANIIGSAVAFGPWPANFGTGAGFAAVTNFQLAMLRFSAAS